MVVPKGGDDSEKIGHDRGEDITKRRILNEMPGFFCSGEKRYRAWTSTSNKQHRTGQERPDLDDNLD